MSDMHSQRSNNIKCDDYKFVKQSHNISLTNQDQVKMVLTVTLTTRKVMDKKPK